MRDDQIVEAEPFFDSVACDDPGSRVRAE